MAATLYRYSSTTAPQLDLAALAATARKILDFLAYFSRMRRYEFHFYPPLLPRYSLEFLVLPNQIIFSTKSWRKLLPSSTRLTLVCLRRKWDINSPQTRWSSAAAPKRNSESSMQASKVCASCQEMVRKSPDPSWITFEISNNRYIRYMIDSKFLSRWLIYLFFNRLQRWRRITQWSWLSRQMRLIVSAWLISMMITTANLTSKIHSRDSKDIYGGYRHCSCGQSRPLHQILWLRRSHSWVVESRQSRSRKAQSNPASLRKRIQ